jgi:hypothetical protein
MKSGTRPAVLLCAAFAAWLLAWAALDRRPPDDHDDFYTHLSIPAAFEAEAAPLWRMPGILARHFTGGTLHPQVAQTTLVATLGTFGVSRFWLRATNAPWLFLLLFGTFLLARQLSGPRLALLAVFLVGTLPIVLNQSRKWDIQFHAACLVPLGLWLAVRALRASDADRPGAGRWWLAFGLWQGMRVYSHPILVPDIVVTLGLVGLARVAPAVLARDTAEVLRRARPWLGSVALVVAVSLWYTGFLGDLIGEPDFSLRRYAAARHSYTEGTWIADASPMAVVRLGADLVRETFWVHLMPGAALLLLPGMLAIPGWLRRPGSDPTTLAIQWMLLGTVLAQVPPAGLAASNRAYFNDWLFIFPTAVVLAISALATLREPMGQRSRRICTQVWVGAVILNGVWVLAAPVVASLVGPDPLDDPAHYSGLPLDLFTHSTSGRHSVTHHMVVRRRLAHSEVAARARAAVGPELKNLSVGLLDLTWDPSRFGASGCRLGDLDRRAAWRFDRPAESSPGSEPTISPWPFAFEDFRSLELVEGASDFDPAAMPRLVLVRLWLDPVHTWDDEANPCVPRERIPDGFIAMARSVALSRLGGSADVRVIDDPTGALVGRTIEWVPDATYLGVGLWIDRGAASGRSTDDDEDV